MKCIRHACCTVAAWMVAFLATPADATVVVSQGLEEMTQTAPVIIEGKVEQVQARWDESGAKIYTYAEISVGKLLKGKVASTVLVKQPGGVVGSMGHLVAGAAQFKPGEKVLLFLEPAVDEKDTYIVWSMAAGKITFRENNLGETRAQRDLEGISFYQPLTPSGKSVRRLEQPSDFGTPEVVLRRIQRALRQRNEGGR